MRREAQRSVGWSIFSRLRGGRDPEAGDGGPPPALARLQPEAAEMAARLAGVHEQLAAADALLPDRRAEQLQQANEQLLLSALQARNDAATSAQTLDVVSRAAELRALAHLHARRALTSQNAELEARVAQRTAELVAARDDALAAVRAKERFLADMSHEIRTPMAGMLGALELLAQTELAPRQSEYLQVAATSGAALLAIINEVLDFAKIHAGRVQLTQEPIDVEAIARSVATLFSAAAQSHSIDLQLVIDPALWTPRIGDGLHVRQVLMNLVGNAMKFTPQGRIELAVRAVDGTAGATVRFEVTDTGIGIAQAQHELIFEPFAQSDQPGRTARGGTGLGLSISRELVQAMGGELRLESELGRGARFYFDLDLARAAAPSMAPSDAAVPARRLSGRVLLVEDNPVNQMVAEAMLESLGLSVDVAADGAAALERLATTPYAAILMDCQMPVMDGWEATRRWRMTERADGRPRTPVIAVTANAYRSDVERCLAAGMDDHLAKPYSLDALHAMLAIWID